MGGIMITRETVIIEALYGDYHGRNRIFTILRPRLEMITNRTFVILRLRNGLYDHGKDRTFVLLRPHMGGITNRTIQL